MLIKDSYKCFVVDASGSRYIDLSLGSGTHILGYRGGKYKDDIIARCKEQIERGTLHGWENPHTQYVTDHLLSINKDFGDPVFCNSGTEATIRAVRLARAYTGKKLVAMFLGGWHGGNDFLLFPTGNAASEGIPKEVASLTMALPYNDTAIDIINSHKNDLAMVIVEPTQGSNPRNNVKDFLQTIRNITTKHGIVFCLDEIITGFRLSFGGSQNYFDIRADMVTYGKIMGGGFPIGALMAKSEIIDTPNVFYGGTFSSNPMTMCASRYTLDAIKNNSIQDTLNQSANNIVNHVNNFCDLHDYPFHMMNAGSIMRMVFCKDRISSRQEREAKENAGHHLKFRNALKSRGVLCNQNGIMFLCTEHFDIIHNIVENIKESISEINN